MEGVSADLVVLGFPGVGVSDADEVFRMSKVLCSAVAVALALSVAAPSLAQPAEWEDRATLPLLNLNCTMFGSNLKKGNLDIHFSGGQAFFFPSQNAGEPNQIRLTQRVIKVERDTLDVLSRARLDVTNFRFPGDPLPVLRTNSPESYLYTAPGIDGEDFRAPKVVRIFLAESLDGNNGMFGASPIAAGLCKTRFEKQIRLSADAASNLVRELVANPALISEKTMDAFQRAVPPAPVPLAGPKQVVDTPAGRTLPMHQMRCAVTDTAFNSGMLEYQIVGGRGYLSPGRSGRSEVLVTPRRMEIKKDELALFADKYPSPSRGTTRQLPTSFFDSAEQEWRLNVGMVLERDPYSSESSSHLIRLSPAFVSRDPNLPAKVAESYFGICEKTTVPQTPLSSAERAQELWK
jgi:hypothetical protein